MKGALLATMAMAMASQNQNHQELEFDSTDEIGDTIGKNLNLKKLKVLHKGHKWYSFDKNHLFTTSTKIPDFDNSIFICSALNNKNAKKKFNKWYENNKS